MYRDYDTIQISYESWEGKQIMPLGWIDFSRSERNKVLSVLEMLTEAGTLDELGIAPVRDGFANLFFPGTSTVQTRAKYFLIVPYALKDLEYSDETNPNRMRQSFDAVERWCGEQFLAHGEDTAGIIGGRSLRQKRWVKRTPADIYWNGLRSYGIFTGGNLSLYEYMRAVCVRKSQKDTLGRLGNRRDNAGENEQDDKDAGGLLSMRFWKIPTYTPGWAKELKLSLTEEEGSFLRTQIITAFPDSMFAYILRNRMTEVLSCKSFPELHSLMPGFPGQIRDDYALAVSFSNFLYVLRSIYNLLVSGGSNEEAEAEWQALEPDLEELAAVDLDAIFGRLHLYGNVFLCNFLRKSRDFMRAGDLDGMKTEIRRRERELKQGRAKTLHPGSLTLRYGTAAGGLDYRFGNAKVLLRDIFESEGCDV